MRTKTMNKNLNYFKVGFTLFSLVIATNTAFADRKVLKEPEILSFDQEAQLSEDYKKALDGLRAEIKGLGDKKLIEKVEQLYKITRKKKVLATLAGIGGGLNKYKQKDPDRYDRISAVLKEVKWEVEEWRFARGRRGMDFQADKKNRRYILSWDKNGGKEVTRTVPMVPRMEVQVKAEYVSLLKDNEEVMAYRYWLENGKKSKGALVGLRLQSLFPITYVEEKFGTLFSFHKRSETLKTTIKYPGGKANDFAFWSAIIQTGDLVEYPPGQPMEFPFELEEIEGGLPGIVECLVQVSGYNPFDSLSPVPPYEDEPSMATDLFAGRTKFMYSGNTIGPVPIPDTFNSGEFIERIISYNEQSIEEGWNDRPPVIRFTREGLEKIKSAPGNKELINDFLAKLDDYKKRKQILSEAYALLKYNLEYLLSKMK